MKFNAVRLRTTFLAAAMVAQAASAATVDQPSVILYGGGATLPANAYVGDTWLDAVPSRRLSNTLPPPAGAPANANAAGKDSLFNRFALSTVGSPGSTANQKAGRVGVSYCQTGSGTGRAVIENNGKDGTGLCGDYSGTPAGFSSDARKADFGASDAPTGQSEINAFNTSAGTPAQKYENLYTQVVQMPAVAGSIAVIYNNPELGKVQLNLTRSDVCGIFSGAIQDWANIDTHTPKLKTALTSKPIKVVVRSDSSGTSFSYTNFLSKVCPSLNLPGDTAVTGFKTKSTYSSGLPTGVSFPASFASGSVASSGNGGVVNSVSSIDGAIGYAEVSDAATRAKRSGGSNLKFATVSFAADQAKSTGVVNPAASFTCPAGTPNKAAPGTALVFDNTAGTKPMKYTCPAAVYNKLDPAKNFLKKGDTAVAVTVKGDEVLAASPGDVDSNGRPVVSPATGVSGYAFGPNGIDDGGTGDDIVKLAGCVLMVEPNAYAEPATAATKAAAADYDRYPAIAVSYLLTYGTGNGTKTADLKSFLKAPFDATILSKVKSIGKTTGFAPVAVSFGSGVPAGVTTMNGFVDACVR